MTAQEYLSQAYRIDQRINSKLEQVKSMRELAAKATTTISDMPRSATPNIHRMEDTIAKMMDMEAEISADINALLDLKRDITAAIREVEDSTYRMLLELRYLSFKSWEEVAAELNYEKRYLIKVHGRALNKVDTKRHQKTSKDT